MDEELSPGLLERLTYLGTKLPSFRDAHEALDVLLRTKIGLKRIERITERLGGERVAEREAEIVDWARRTLTEKLAAPVGVKPPQGAAVLADGGRIQLREAAPDAPSHWHEYKAGVLHSLASEVHEHDPCPEVPELFLQRADRQTGAGDHTGRCPSGTIGDDDRRPCGRSCRTNNRG